MINTRSSFCCAKLYENGMDKIGRGYCFMGYQETITFILEMIGTIAFAASGALVGSEQKTGYFRSFGSWGDHCSWRWYDS